MHRYFAIHKPYEMLSQFIGGRAGQRMLGELDFEFPEGIHAIGRLDYHSEGLLLLTTNKAVTRLLFQSEEKHKRTYLVQAYKAVSPEVLHLLRTGIVIKIAGDVDYTTTPCEVNIVPRPDHLLQAAHELPSSIHQTWMTMTLTEGKYRQIRKMLKAARHACRRLVRLSIEEIELEGLPPGGVREMDEATFFRKLHIPYPAANNDASSDESA